MHCSGTSANMAHALDRCRGESMRPQTSEFIMHGMAPVRLGILTKLQSHTVQPHPATWPLPA